MAGQLIEKLINSGRMYYNPEQFQLVNRHTTEVLVTNQDLANTNKRSLNRIINTALEYNGDMRDYKVIDNFDQIQPELYHKNYSVFGLYLYLADEVSRCPTGKTFLQASRDTQAKFEASNKTKDDRIEWFVDTLKELKLYEDDHIQKLVKDWTQKGCFYICGELQYQDNSGTGKTFGTYPELAKKIGGFGKERYLQIAHCISRALGAKEDYVGLTSEQALEKTRSIISSSQSDRIIDKEIESGKNIRKDYLTKLILKLGINDPKPISKEGRDFYNNMFSYFPEHALEILDAEKYRLAFTDKDDLRTIYPKDNLSGLSDKSNEDTRGSMGTRNSRHKLAFFAKGIGRSAEPFIVAQTILHEELHIALNSDVVTSDSKLYGVCNESGQIIQEGKIPQLYRKVFHIFSQLDDEAQEKLRNMTSKAMPGANLAALLNATSNAYRNYTLPDQNPTDYQWEQLKGQEVTANIFGLMHTEFSKESAPGNNPFFNDDSHLKPLVDLAQEVNEVMKEAAVAIVNNRQQVEKKPGGRVGKT